MGFKLIYNEQISVINIIYLIIYQEALSAFYAKKRVCFLIKFNFFIFNYIIFICKITDFFL